MGTVGTYEYVTLVGMNTSVALENDILSNAYVVHPNSQRVRIVSSSNNDRLTGIGIQKIAIIYFTNTWEYKTEVIPLNGTTPVDSINTDIYRIQRFSAIQVGTNKNAVGTITMKSTDGSNLFAQIDPGYTAFRRSLWYVRKGYKTEIESIILNCSSPLGVEFNLHMTFNFTSAGGGYVDHGFVPIILKNNIFLLPDNMVPIMDASNSSRPLCIYCCVRGLAVDQNASAYLYMKEYRVK